MVYYKAKDLNNLAHSIILTTINPLSNKLYMHNSVFVNNSSASVLKYRCLYSQPFVATSSIPQLCSNGYR